MQKIYTKLLWLLIFAAGLLGANKSVAQSGIFESYAILNINGGGNQYYDMQATTANPDFQGATLGNFNASNSLVVVGGQNKTFKCAPCDITNGNFYYRVWLTSAGASGTFTNINEPFLANLGTGCGGNDQTWQGTGGTTNIIAGLTTPGNYTLEVYSAADYQGCGTGTHFSSNGGANYKATFNFCGPTSGALPAGNYTIPGCFPTIAAAVNYINANGVTGTGNVQFSVAAGYTETAPAGGYAITATGTATLGIKFVKSGTGADPTITASGALTAGALNDAIFKLIGADYITIDGFTMLENAANTTTAAATNNMTEWGVALLYNAVTDGAQNNTIQNNTITLNRTYQNTFGIYSNATHSATAVTTSVTATGAAGGNNGLKIYSNNISNVNNGIVIVGPTAAADAQTGIEVGGTAGTANTISNFGTTGTFSGYANVSGTVNGILVRNSTGFTISYNNITSSAGGVTAGTLNGIQVPGASATPTGSFTNNINNNTIALQSGLAAGAINGINYPTGSASATSVLNVNGNNFTQLNHSVAATAVIQGIVIASTNLTTSISNNLFSNITTNTTGNFTFISASYNAPANGSKIVNGNSIVTAFNKTGAGGTVALYLDGGSSTTGTTVQNNNNNFSNVTVTGATAITGWFNNDGTGATPGKTITGNTFNNWTCGTGAVVALQSNFGNTLTFTGNTVTNITGQGSITGMLIGSSGTYANPMNFSGNTVTGLSSTGAGGAVTGISNGAAAPSVGLNSISGNTVNTLSSTSTTATVAGISSSGSGVNINGNTINTLSCVGTTSGVANGIMVTAGLNVSVFKNKIYDLQTTGAFTTAPGVNGIVVSGTSSTTTYNVYNNLVGDLKAPAATSTDAIRGISVTATGGSTTHNISFNSVYINANTSGANFGTSGIFHTTSATATTASLVLRNNIIKNTSTPVGTGVTAAYRRSSTTLANYNAASNNNLFYGGIPGAANLIFTDGTNNDQTLAAYKARVAARDGASVTENPPFLSVVGSSANFLHINNAVATQVESGAATIAGITDDYDGDTRNATTPDIGADEGNFLLADISGPSITYTPLGNTACPADITLAPVTVTDASGVNIAAGTRPRLYYKKSTNANTYVDNTNATDGWKYVEATGAGGSPFSFTTNYALLFGGAPVVGDSISYFVVAQDVVGTPNIGINSGTFAAAPASVALAAAAFPLAGTVNGYRLIAAGLSGTVTIGAAGTYPSLSGAGGLFAAINTNGMSGSVTANIIDASVAETGAVALNAINYNGCATGPYPLLIKPDAGVTTVLTGAVGTGSVIKLNGADFVTFDGSNNGTNSRNMTIQNTTTTATGNAVIWLASPALGNGANNDTIKNCIIEGNSATTTFIGVHIGGSTAIGIATAGNERNNNNTITNNLFRKSQYGLTMYGISAANPDQNNTVNNNNFGTATAGEGFSLLAINAEKQQNLVVAGNEVQNVTNATNTSSTPFGGIRLIDFKDGFCYKNNVHDLAYTNASTSKIYGIAITSTSYNTAGNPSNARIYNNMVSRITSTGISSVWNTTGILSSAGYGDKYYYNTVNLNGQVANSSSGLVAAFANGDGNFTSVCTNIDVRNNIFSLTGSNGTAGGNFWAYYTTAVTLTGSTLNYNDLYCNSTGATNNVGRFNATSYATLAAWQTATAQEANSVSIAPVFVSNSDAHLVPGSNTTLDNLGTPIAGITDDIDGDARSATTPDMGADEFTAPTCTTAVGGTASGSVNGCVSYAGNITASGYSTGIGTTFQWVSATNPAGPWTAISGATNPAAYTISPAVTVTTYYKLAVACATNSSVDSSTMVTITINPRPTATTDQTGTVTVCNPQTSQIIANTDAASPAYQWKKDGANISGETNAQLIVAVSGVYQVVVTNTLTGCKDSSAPVTFRFVNPPTAPTVTPTAPTICPGNVQLLTASGSVINGTADLGTSNSVTIASTTTSALGPNPLQSYYGGAKQQMIVQASELTGLGFTNGSVISALAFNMNVVEARTLQNYTVKVSNTALNAFTSTTFEPAGTVVRNPANFTPVAGWNTITFDNNYTWNGSSNLLIEVNFSNNDAGGTGTNTAIYSTTGFASTLFYRVDNTAAAAVDGTTTASFAAYTQRNNMRFTVSTPVSAYEWLPATGLFTDAAGTIPYVAGTYTPMVYASPTGTTNYTAKSLSVTCENTTPFTVTVTAPTSPNGLAGTPTPGATSQYCENRDVANGLNYVEAATCNLIAKITPAGVSPVAGVINACVRVDTGATKMGTARLYAARFYDVLPATSAATATGTVKLYFLQSEFDNYNLKALDSGYYPLPLTGGGNTDSLRILIYHGVPSGGYFPGNYSGAVEELSTADAGVSVVWNPAGNNGSGWWEVSFPANGFSGYFISSKVLGPVPIKIAYFRGAKQGSSHILDWKVVPVNTANGTISLERSSDGRSFSSIYSITASATRMLQPFNYGTNNLLKGTNYYRLKMTDDNGVVTYSSIVALLNSNKGFELVNMTPNPVTEGHFKLNITAAEQLKMEVVVTDMMGRIVSRQTNNLISGFNAIEVNVNTLTNGMYQVMGIVEGERTKTLKFVKQ